MHRVARRLVVALFVVAFAALAVHRAAAEGTPVRIGILGVDNYQCTEYTRMFNDPKAPEEFSGLKVVAAYPGGSPDIPESVENLPKWRDRLQQSGIEIVDSIPELIKRVDAVMIWSLDGRAHLEQARPVLEARKPLMIGRPMAASLADVDQIFRLAEANKTPVWSSSQHRFSPGFIGMRNHPEVGNVLGCDVYGGCPTEPHHPELFWHAVHGIDTLFTIMGPGCVSVRCESTPYAEHITGVWSDGRVGTFRGIKIGKLRYSATVFGDNGVSISGIYGHGVPTKWVVPTNDAYMGYKGIGVEIARFFKTGEVPVTPRETLEVFAFMDAAHASKAQNGATIKIADILARVKRD